jgi:hypothetical protein
MYLSTEKAELILKMFLNGMSVSATRRSTRLTNAVSKKWANRWAAVSLWYAFYYFCRIHKSLRVTPAMSAGISDHVWDVAELLQ